MAGLKFFCDSFSQPCRAVLMLLEANKVPYEMVTIKIAKGEHMSDEYKAVNPAKTVPAIDDGGFQLFESASIMRYIVEKFQLPDHWYPGNLQQRAKINEYLDWHHQNLRRGAAPYIFLSYFGPRITGMETDKDKVEEARALLGKSSRFLEKYFLKDTKFINSNEISIADLQAVCELTTFWAVGEDPCKDMSRLAKWMEDCKNELQPHFDVAHKMVYMARDRGIFKKSEQSKL